MKLRGNLRCTSETLLIRCIWDAFLRRDKSVHESKSCGGCSKEEEEAGKVQEYKEEGSLSENENNNTAEINNVKPDGMNNVNVGSKKLEGIVIKQEVVVIILQNKLIYLKCF